MSSFSGERFYGLHGAAGLLLVAPAPDGTPTVLLQLRASWTHQGGTWGIPGGALDSDETPAKAALREAYEEAGIRRHAVTVRAAVVTLRPVGTTWTYTTVLATAAEQLATHPSAESAELRWVPVADVTRLSLHPGFAASWPNLRELVA